ncbi:MAG: hypothetical protein HYY16_19130 [Planctomycetes bacterium]|nr:hypothetical protein [Planctomycetota bacterium]
MFGKKGGILISFAAFSLFATVASAGTYCYWGGVCDSNFDSWARSLGYSSGNNAIVNYNWSILKWIERNSDADVGGFTYYGNARWDSPAWWSGRDTFLGSLDVRSTFEENGRYFFMNGFTDKGCGDAAGAASPYSFGRDDKNLAFMSSYNSGWRWKSALMHEDGHLLRNDGWHHEFNDPTITCALDTYDQANYGTTVLCLWCIGVINWEQ